MRMSVLTVWFRLPATVRAPVVPKVSDPPGPFVSVYDPVADALPIESVPSVIVVSRVIVWSPVMTLVSWAVSADAFGTVAGDHDHAGNACLAHHPDRPRRIGTKLVGEQQCADRSPLDRDKDRERRTPRGAPDRPRSPFTDVAAETNHIARTYCDPPSVDHRAPAGRPAGHHEFVAGALSVADFAILGWAWRHERHKVSFSDFPQVGRWYDAMMARPAVKRGMEAKLD